jgi:hypothetical protein
MTEHPIKTYRMSIDVPEQKLAKSMQNATWVIAASTLINIVISAFLWITTKSQVEYTRYMYETSQRPYVGFLQSSHKIDREKKTFVYKLMFTNAGNTTAQNVFIQIEGYLNNHKIPPTEDEPKPTVMFPQGKILHTGLVEGDHFDAMMKGLSVFKLEMTATYQGAKNTQYVCRQEIQFAPDANAFTDLGAVCP